jgi:hypothetical protein
MIEDITYAGTPTVNTNVEIVELESLAERAHGSKDDAKLVPAGEEPEAPKRRAPKKR